MARPNANTRLLEAARKGDTDGARAALASGAFPNTRDVDGRTALHLAALHRHVATLKAVAEHADIDYGAIDRWGLRPIHCACMGQPGVERASTDDPAVVEALILRGENAGALSEGGDTALILAARWEQTNICEYLLNLPSVFSVADTKRGSAGVTAEETARTWGYPRLADLIHEKATMVRTKPMMYK